METLQLDAKHAIMLDSLPPQMTPESKYFEALWSLHPPEYPEIEMRGQRVRTPRWYQAYGRDYSFSGAVAQALPIPVLIQPFLEWAQLSIDQRLNGLLTNWYDGQRKHYIGKHRDKTHGLVHGAPIVTISLGEERVFRMRPWRGTGSRDLLVSHGSVIVIPYETNTACTHEVPHRAQDQGRRISITIRAFTD